MLIFELKVSFRREPLKFAERFDPRFLFLFLYSLHLGFQFHGIKLFLILRNCNTGLSIFVQLSNDFCMSFHVSSVELYTLIKEIHYKKLSTRHFHL